MESYQRFQQSRVVIEDFSSHTLAAIPTVFGRLYYVSSLRSLESGRYEHDGLLSLYPDSAVQAALAHCHEELFFRILETPLEEQEHDLLSCLDTAGEQYWAVIEDWQETQSYQTLCPEGLPDYLQDLFRSNMSALLSIFTLQHVD